MNNYAETWFNPKDEMASMALPSGHAASTSEFWYLICFTKVISCQGSRPAQKDERSEYQQDMAHEIQLNW